MAGDGGGFCFALRADVAGAAGFAGADIAALGAAGSVLVPVAGGKAFTASGALDAAGRTMGGGSGAGFTSY